MLGLANAISGTATIVDRKYSAYFDGTGDYIDTGITGQSTIRADFSWSLWVKPTDGQPGSDMDILGAENSSGEDKIYIRLATTGKIWLIHESNNDDATYQTANVVFPNGACDWTHIAVRVQYTDGGADTSYNIYVNGYAVNGTLTDAVSEANHELYTSDINFFIGGRNNNGSVGNAFVGYIDEVAFYNVQTAAATVESIYNSGRPFDLRNNLNSYNTKAHLIFYYKMFDGLFDDRVNGIVHDQDGPAGYGTEMVTNGTFDDATGWTISGEAGWAISGGTLTYTDNTGNENIGYADHLAHTDFTEGVVYKIEFDCIDSHNVLLYIKGTTAVNGIQAAGHHVFYATAGSSSSVGIRFAASLVAANGSIDNLSVKRLNGSPGIASGNTTFNTSTPHTQAMSSVATFDGTGDHLNVGNVLDFGTADFSVSAWFKGSDLTSFPIITKREDANNVWRLITDSADKISWVATADGNATGSGVGGTALTALQDSWIHACVTADRDGGYVLYINGTTSTYGKTSASMANSSQNLDNDGLLLIGKYDLASEQHANGLIDEVAIWNVALDADAVAAIHTAGRNYDLTADTGNYDNSSSLQGYWRMNLETKESNVYVGHPEVIHDTPGGVRGENLISNGDFETAGASETDATGWTTTATATHNERSSDYAFKGTHSWKYTSSTTNHGVQHDITGGVEAGKTYELSYWCYTVNPGGGSTTYAANNWINVSAGTILNIGDGNNYGGAGSSSGYGNWFKVTNYFYCHTTDTSATIRLGNGGAAAPTTYYFDDVQFKEVTGNPAIPVADATTIRQPV